MGKLVGPLASTQVRSISHNVCLQTYVPFPNARQGCPLTPRTRKRLKPEVPPSPVLRERMKRFKEEHGIGELELELE